MTGRPRMHRRLLKERDGGQEDDRRVAAPVTQIGRRLRRGLLRGSRRAHLIYTPKTREELSYLIGIRSPSRGGGRGGRGCLNFHTMNWWTMEFVVVDVGATLVLLLGYLALMIRKAVL